MSNSSTAQSLDDTWLRTCLTRGNIQTPCPTQVLPNYHGTLGWGYARRGNMSLITRYVVHSHYSFHDVSLFFSIKSFTDLSIEDTFTNAWQALILIRYLSLQTFIVLYRHHCINNRILIPQSMLCKYLSRLNLIIWTILLRSKCNGWINVIHHAIFHW